MRFAPLTAIIAATTLLLGLHPALAGTECANEIVSADRTLREHTRGCLKDAAAQIRRSLDPGDVAICSREDLLMTNMAIFGVENLTPEHVFKGADLCFIYLDPKGERQMDLPPGFYVINLQFDPDTKVATARYINQDNRVVLTNNKVRISVEDPDSKAAKIKVTGSIRPKKVTVDIHITIGKDDSPTTYGIEFDIDEVAS